MSWWPKLLLAVAAPLVVFGLVELGLVAAGVRPLIETEDPTAGFSDVLGIYEADRESGEYRTTRRASHKAFARQQFRIEKPDDGFRLFTLGGSSARGFPWGDKVAFTRLLGEALQRAWPERTVEAVNAGGMSYASHRLEILARELVRYEPDVFVLYGGHNEFIERRFYDLERSDALDGVRLLTHRWRLYSALQRAADRARAEPGDAEGRTTGQLLGVDVQRHNEDFDTDAERRAVRDTYERNVRAILELARDHGVPVVVCTVAANLVDWRPNKSLLDPGLSPDARDRFAALVRRGQKAGSAGDTAAAAEALAAASVLDPGHAQTHYRLGRAYQRLGRWDEALASFVRARDTDAQPSRTISSLNETLAALAVEYGLPFLDAEALLVEASPNRQLGFNLIEDYVHPNLEGHRRIAHALYRLVRTAGIGAPAGAPDEAAFAAAVAHVDAENADDPHAQGESAAMLFNTAVVLTSQGHRDQAIEKYRAAVALSPRYWPARANLGQLLYETGSYEEALAEFEILIEALPDRTRHRIAKGWALLALERDAVEVFREASQRAPEDPKAWLGLGVAEAAQGRRLAEARAALERAVELAPHAPQAVCKRGRVRLRAGAVDAAVESLQDCVRLSPESAAWRAWLGRALQRQGATKEAIAAYRAALEIDPRNAYARAALERLGGAR